MTLTAILRNCRIISLQPLSVLRPVRKNSKYTGQVNDKEWDQPNNNLLFVVFRIFTVSCFHLNTEVVNLILTRATTYVQILSVHIEGAKSVAYVVLKKG